MRVKNKKLWEHLKANLKDFKIEAGWFENTKYDENTSVGYIAGVQNYGAAIKNPGGQPYYINSSTEMAVFVKKDSLLGEHLISQGKVTKPHTIVIPPRPFMEHAKERIEGKEGKQILLQEMLRVFDGKQTMLQATERIGTWCQGIIQEEIKKITTPSLAKSTVRTREKRYVSKRKKGSASGIDKPLVDTGIMFSTVQHKVTIKQ